MILVGERLRLSPMRSPDILAVRDIEIAVFPTPWPSNAYQRELDNNSAAHYFCLWREGELVGYGGLWCVGEEAHVTTIGIRTEDQGKGYGKVMFAALVNMSYSLGANFISLEVRPGNEPAIHLYERFGFKVIGRRRGYYTDNGEDALVMWSGLIQAPGFKRGVRELTREVEVEGMAEPPSEDYTPR